MPWLINALPVIGNLLAGIGAWSLLDWFKPHETSASKQQGQSFFTLERVCALAGLGITIYYFVIKKGGKRW